MGLVSRLFQLRPKAGQHIVGIDISPGLAGTCTRVQATGDESSLLLAKPDLGADGLLHETGQGFTFLQDRFGRFAQGRVDPQGRKGRGLHVAPRALQLRCMMAALAGVFKRADYT